jgi:orotidine-5'-phosphate decarboxylase
MNFTQKLQHAVDTSQSLLCVGLDPDPFMIPSPLKKEITDDAKLTVEFCLRIIEATKTSACAFKPNMAFFEALGSKGWEALEQIVDAIPSGKVIIADAKRGDIGNTAARYSDAILNQLGADAITLNPLMGLDTLDPFLSNEEKAIFVLVMTSNRGAADFLQRRFEGRLSLGEYIAEELSKKQSRSRTHIGMVAGATQPGWLEPVLKAHPNAHLLIPGIGKQGGSIDDMVDVLRDHKGIPIFNSSRSIIYAGDNLDAWELKVGEAAAALKQNLEPITNRYVSK